MKTTSEKEIINNFLNQCNDDRITPLKMLSLCSLKPLYTQEQVKLIVKSDVEQLQKELKEKGKTFNKDVSNGITQDYMIIDTKDFNEVFNNFKGNNLKCVFCGEPVKGEGHLGNDVCLKCFKGK